MDAVVSRSTSRQSFKLKVWPETFTSDPDRRARFEREGL